MKNYERYRARSTHLPQKEKYRKSTFNSPKAGAVEEDNLMRRMNDYEKSHEHVRRKFLQLIEDGLECRRIESRN